MAPSPYFRTCVSSNVDVINTFLGGHLVKISRLSPGGIAVASTFELSDMWKNPGVRNNIKMRNGAIVEGMQLSTSRIYNYISGTGQSGYLAQDWLSSGLTCSFMSTDGLDFNSGQEIVDFVSGLSLEPTHSFEGVICPTVDIKHIEDISWLIGMPFGDSQQRIDYAAQGASLTIDENGLKAKAAAVITTETTCPCEYVRPPPPLIINGPFLVFVTDYSNGVPEHILVSTVNPLA